ncbi:flagellar export chaperone FliS [Clostridium beijerinckii]|uniref:Flagellar secretion chaperone FliS n=1 Tax=Clostridium beijerinckii TaxID=1520 RepID=A0A1S8PHU6_CLOBE|nr:flagellar export chaperone FliS [Clostridium beijerinckii]NRT37028.1 flagellar protein FliS [Clostridium beijerinckii]NRT43538.1 flagellar protein FliS [Clostridium beijerinckii]NRT79373.1 flagellar protein FliS [Clostridium beijerinckii]NRZ22470.1 flagellar protein FliS [Clostridium beijerinckii]NSB12949.1 flagellar protein FliS [Clostridium beijerinckii]
MYTNGYNVYKNNSVNYASKEQLLLMLVDGAVKFAKIARQAMVDKDIKKAHENVVKTEDIFLELMATLDTSAGKWAENMFAVYRFINEKLFEANIKKDVAIMDEVLPLIEDVRNIWYEAEERARKANA